MSIIHSMAYHAGTLYGRLSSGSVRRAAALLRAGETADLETLMQGRSRAFVDLARHCYQDVPYYRRLMDERGIRPETITSLHDIARFPALTKTALRDAGASLRAGSVLPRSTVWRRSGGTTGEPITSYLDPFTRAVETYSHLRGLRWIGWRPGVPIVRLWGGSLGRAERKGLRASLRSMALNDLTLPAFELRHDTAPRYFRAIRQSGGCVLVGYSSALYLLARYAEEHGVRDLPITLVVPTAAQMPAHWAEEVSHIFSCPVRGYYGCAEINGIGYQLAQGGPYVVCDEHVLVERAGDVLEGGYDHPDDLLLTSLYNRAQPLIRYLVGDMGTVAPPGACHPTRSCIVELQGRSADMFTLSDGSRLSANFGGKIISRLKPPVKRFQFIQWALDRVEFRYEPLGDGPSSDQLDEIASVIRYHMGDSVRLETTQTSDFILPVSGKHRIMISEICHDRT